MKKLFLLLITFCIFLSGCDKEDKDKTLIEKHIQQGWKLTTASINGSQVNLSSIPLPELMVFTEQSLCYLATPVYINKEWSYEDQRTAWSYDHSNGILNIAGLLPVTNYIRKVESNLFIIYYYLYNENGELDMYEKTYQSAKVAVQDLKVRLIE